MEPNDVRLKNLKPIKKGEITKEEAKKRGSKGGKKSVQVKKEKKLISDIYKQFLLKKHKATFVNYPLKEIETFSDLSSDELFEKSMTNLISRSDNSSVALMREMREATEGSKIALTGADGDPLIPPKIQVEFVKPDAKPKSKNNKG